MGNRLIFLYLEEGDEDSKLYILIGLDMQRMASRKKPLNNRPYPKPTQVDR
jgi:hypothetical protein